MVDITKLDAEGIKNLSPEDMQEALLKGWEELGKARGVIATLNKNKGWNNNNSWDDETKGFNKEQLDEYYQEKKAQESLDNFISENSEFEDKKEQFSELMWKGLTLEQAKWAIVASDETFSNNRNTNQAWVGSWNSWQWTWFTGKIDFDTYDSMSSEEKASYEKFSDENFWWLDFDYNVEKDMD